MPYIVNTQPGTPRWGDYLGQGFASGAEKGIDVLLKALLEGQLMQFPQGKVTQTGSVNQLPLPGGKIFSGTPEAAQRFAQGTPGTQFSLAPYGPAAPNSLMTPPPSEGQTPAQLGYQPPIAPRPELMQAFQALQRQIGQGQLTPAQLPAGLSFTQTGTRLGLGPNLDRQLKQSQINENIARTKALANPGIAYKLDTSGNLVPVLTPEGQTVSGKTKIVGTAGVTSQNDIQDVVQGIKDGDIPPNPAQLSYRDKTRVMAELQRQGVNVSKLQTDWTVMQTYAKNANSTQQVRMRQALESVRQGIGSLGTLSEEFSRTGWTPANYAVLKTAMTGTDPTRRDQATRFVTQLTVMKDELAQGFMGGGVPTERALQLADEVLNPLYGNMQLGAALDQLNTNLGIRLNAINSILPVTLGETSPQYQGMMGQVSPNQTANVTPSTPTQSSTQQIGRFTVTRH